MDTKLKQLRSERCWSQARVIYELGRISTAQQIGIMNPISLRTALSRWENGHVQPDSFYAGLLAQAFGCRVSDLGLTTPESRAGEAEQSELAVRLASSQLVDARVLAAFELQTQTIRQLDRRLGAPAVAEQTRAHVAIMNQLLAHATSSTISQPLASALADAAALAGWQSLDAGRTNEAWAQYELAKNAARAAGDEALLAHAQGEQGFVLLDLGRAGEAQQMIRDARTRHEQALPARLRSWLLIAEAEAAAAATDIASCHNALEAAAASLPSYAADEDLPYLTLDAHHFERWRGSCLARLGDKEATAHLETALDELDADFIRARGALHLDLAEAFTALRVRDAAVLHLGHARSFAAQTGSVRQNRRIVALAA